MATPFTISRVTTLPSPLVPNTMYIIRETPNLAKLAFVGDTPSVLATTYSRVDAQNDITEAIAEAKSVYVFGTYSAMLVVRPEVAAIAYVKNASGDPTATTPSAAYAWDPLDTTWHLLPGAAGGAPVDVQWDRIIGRPTATPVQIDLAVTQSHTHANKVVLDQLSEANNRLQFRGVPVSEVQFMADW